MKEELTSQLTAELRAFNGLAPTSSINAVTEAYDRILTIVQALMLSSDDPDSHARAWSLLNDDAYKYLAEIQGGNTNALDDLKYKMVQIGETLFSP
ncbi:hypothetical protein GCM10028808_60480 [Spirosoma migulaei]